MSKIIKSAGRIYNQTSIISQTIRNFHLSAYAASMAFFIFLSMVPMLMLICTIIPYTPIDEQTLVYFATQFAPETFSEVLTNLINEVFSKSGSILPISAVIMIWSAAKGIVSLMYALNNINKTPENRPYLVTRAIACLYTVVFLIGIVLTLLLIVFGSTIRAALLLHFPLLDNFLTFIMRFRIIFVWAFLTLTFALVYAFVPANRKKFKNQLPGAFCCSVAWTAFSVLFSFYVSHTDSFGVYGSLSLIVILLFWLYACMNIILYCSYINIFCEKLAETRKERKNGI